MKIKAKDLKLADTIVLNATMPFNRGVVNKVESGTIRVFRPYVQTADFSYTDGVICYIGIEEFSFTPNPDEEFEVLERKELK